ncbi:MAG: CHAT domain-containing protein [Acidobacteria bacterium]|nr:CHAT domain-containing protein [Acidobacteriota bacterium]
MMSNDFLVEILPAGGDELNVYLSAAEPPLDRESISLRRITLPPEDLDTIRRGDSPKNVTDKVAIAMSDWLVGGQVKGYLDTALKSKSGDPIRLVFKVDEKLLPMLADLPFELLNFNGDWLALRQGVDAIVHLLQKARTTALPLPPSSHNWPLRILIVRSNPRELGGAVPKAAPVCGNIIALTEELGDKLVQVDLLSSEFTEQSKQAETNQEKEAAQRFLNHLKARNIEAVEPATWEKFQRCLEDTSYDVLVYLGHGNLPEAVGGIPPLGELELEQPGEEEKPGAPKKPGAQFAHAISADQLKNHLQNYPVPVVLLAGCVTASEFDTLDEEKRKALLEEIPRMMRGSQGVAQALVNSEAGVQCAVGMRYKLERNLAVTFLNAFFDSLLRRKPGHVEAAIRAGREKMLALTGAYPPSWSAPVIFRKLGKEPMFDFLTKPPKYELTEFDIRDQEARESYWAGLAESPGMVFASKLLDKVEGDLRKRGLAAGAVFEVSRLETKVGAPELKLLVSLSGALSVEQARVKVTCGAESVRVDNVRSTEALKSSGYALQDMSEFGAPSVSFTLKWTKGGAPEPMPTVPLVEVRLEIDPVAAATVYSVNLDVETEPPRVVRPIGNAVIVSPA